MNVPGGRFAVEIPDGWHAVWRDARASETPHGALVISGPGNDFRLSITPWWLARPWMVQMVAEEATWETISVFVSEARNEAREPRRACGDFRASEWKLSRRYELLRGWFLNADEVVLRVDYTADPAVGSRDDAALRQMMDSMRLLPAAGPAPDGGADGTSA